MKKYIKYIALAAIIAVGSASQASAASVCINLGNGVSLSYNNGANRQVKHKMAHNMKDKHRHDQCRDCRRRFAHHAHRNHHK